MPAHRRNTQLAGSRPISPIHCRALPSPSDIISDGVRADPAPGCAAFDSTVACQVIQPTTSGTMLVKAQASVTMPIV